MFKKEDFKYLNLGILHKICKNYSILKYSKLNKMELIQKINEYYSVIKIQKYYRNYFYKNAVDHITLEKVEYPCFVFRTKCGKCYFYAYESIINYIMKTGDTRDPMTRTQYSDEVLTRLDSSAKLALPGIKLKSTLKIKKNPEYARRIRNKLNEILSYQSRLSELKILLINFIDSGLIFINMDNIFIDNIEYTNTSVYLNSVIYEIKTRLRNLLSLDQHSSESFKSELTDNLKELILNEDDPYKKSRITDILQSF